MYDPYSLDAVRRRQPQADIQIPAFQPPQQPMMAQPTAPPPSLPQWVPMGDQQGQQQQDMSTGAAGMVSLLKRFQKPMGSAKGGMSMGGFGGKA